MKTIRINLKENEFTMFLSNVVTMNDVLNFRSYIYNQVAENLSEKNKKLVELKCCKPANLRKFNANTAIQDEITPTSTDFVLLGNVKDLEECLAEVRKIYNEHEIEFMLK